MLAAIMAQRVRLALLGEMEFRSGTLDVWTGTYPLIWGAKTFSGVGPFGSINRIAETADGSAQGVTMALSGVPNSLLAAALDEDYQGQPVHVWLACFDDNWTLLDAPYKIFMGIMDIMTVQRGAPSGTISMQCESRMIELNRPRVRRYTQGDQQIDFPTDKGFSFVNSIQLLQLFWGNPSGPSAALPGSAAQVQNVIR